MSNYNKPKHIKVKIDEIKHHKAKEVAQRVGLLEYGTTDKDRLKSWKEKKVNYEDLSCYAESGSECYKYGSGRNTKYLYRTPVHTSFTHSIDHYNYGIFNQEPSPKELGVLLMGGESVKYESKDVAKNVGKKLFKQVFGFNLPNINISRFFAEEEVKQEDIIVKLHNFLESDIRDEQAATVDEFEYEEYASSETYDFEYDELDIKELLEEKSYHDLIKQIDNYEYECNDMVMKF